MQLKMYHVIIFKNFLVTLRLLINSQAIRVFQNWPKYDYIDIRMTLIYKINCNWWEINLKLCLIASNVTCFINLNVNLFVFLF